jgi:hypothetical protein
VHFKKLFKPSKKGMMIFDWRRILKYITKSIFQNFKQFFAKSRFNVPKTPICQNISREICSLDKANMGFKSAEMHRISGRKVPRNPK